MHTTTELNVTADASVRPGANGMVELVFLGADDDSSMVVKVYAAQAEAIRKGLAALQADAS